MASIKRHNSEDTTDSQSEQGAEDGVANLNSQWIHFRLAWVAYFSAIFIVWFSIHTMSGDDGFFKPNECWTITNVVHGIVSFAILHWVKGSPDEATQGAYDHLTLFEQIQNGKPWTKTKKFLMLVPTILAYMGCEEAKFGKDKNGKISNLYPIVVNCGIFLIMIISKIPEMYRVRVFGINSSPGVDKPLNSAEFRSVNSSNKLKGN